VLIAGRLRQIAAAAPRPLRPPPRRRMAPDEVGAPRTSGSAGRPLFVVKGSRSPISHTSRCGGRRGPPLGHVGVDVEVSYETPAGCHHSPGFRRELASRAARGRRCVRTAPGYQRSPSSPGHQLAGHACSSSIGTGSGRSHHPRRATIEDTRSLAPLAATRVQDHVLACVVLTRALPAPVAST